MAEAEAQYSALTLRDNGDPKYLRQQFLQLAAQYPRCKVDDERKFAIIIPVSYTHLTLPTICSV